LLGRGGSFLALSRGEEGGPEPLEQAFRLPLRGWRGVGRLWLGAPGWRSRLQRGGLLDRGFLDALGFGTATQVQMPFLYPRDQLIARLFGGQPLRILGTDPFDTEVRGLQVRIGEQQDVDPLALFDAKNGIALFVQQEGGHVHRQLRQDALGVLLHGLLLQDAENGEGQGLDAADGALALAARADELTGLAQGGAQALA
jgi:hypothetical protein